MAPCSNQPRLSLTTIIEKDPATKGGAAEIVRFIEYAAIAVSGADKLSGAVARNRSSGFMKSLGVRDETDGVVQET